MPPKQKPFESTVKEDEAPTPEPVAALPPAVRVEFFSVGGKWGYRRCAADGAILAESRPQHAEIADAIGFAEMDDANKGLALDDPRRPGRPHARW